MCYLCFPVVTCNVADVNNATKSPNELTVDYGVTVIYECDVGFSHSQGDLNRTCHADGTLDGNTTVCSGKIVVSKTYSNDVVRRNWSPSVLSLSTTEAYYFMPAIGLRYLLFNLYQTWL